MDRLAINTPLPVQKISAPGLGAGLPTTKPMHHILFHGSSLSAGAYTTAWENWWGKLICDQLMAAFPDHWFAPCGVPEASYFGSAYGYGGKGSITINPTFCETAVGGPYNSWKGLPYHPEFVVLEHSVNNLVEPGTFIYDECLDRCEQGVTRGYNSFAECESWYTTDITAGAAWLGANYGIPYSKMFLVGQWPMGTSATFDNRGERFVGGTGKGQPSYPDSPAGEAMWNHWNYDIIQPLAVALGAHFIDLHDVYGVDFDPTIEPNPYTKDNSMYQVHVNKTGSQMWADTIAPQMIVKINL